MYTCNICLAPRFVPRQGDRRGRHSTGCRQAGKAAKTPQAASFRQVLQQGSGFRALSAEFPTESLLW